jgi:cell division protein FtsB
MLKKIQQLRLKYPFLKIIWNRYVLVLLFFVIWMLFLDNYSYLDHSLLNKEIIELEDNQKYYKDEIASDSIKIKKLQNPDMIEKYAREKYFMKKDSEDIYIIEFEDDMLEEESKKDF